MSLETAPGNCRESSQRGGACNLCGGKAAVVLDGAPTLVRCLECGLVSLDRFPPPAEREARYQGSYYSEERGERFLRVFELIVGFFARRRMQAIRKRAPGPGRILDVGCGRGNLLERFQKNGWQAVGTQISRSAANAARTLRGVEVIVGELPELDLPPSSFQAITFFHVLEHLARPAEYLQKAHELLADDGLLLVEVPNFASPAFRLLGQRSFCLDYPNHLVFFTPSSLRDLLDRSGFAVEEVSRFSLEYSPYTTLQNLINFLPGQPNRLYRALSNNREGVCLRRSPWTWLHFMLGALLFLPALAISLTALRFGEGNTMRLYCRKKTAGAKGEKSTTSICRLQPTLPHPRSYDSHLSLWTFSIRR